MSSIIYNNITKKYGEKVVLDNISFATGEGFHFLAGRNGAGKTTLIRCSLGLDEFTAGEFSYDGKGFAQIRDSVAVVFDSDKLYHAMTGYDNLKIFCARYLKNDELTEELLTSLDLSDELMKRKVKTFSFGQNHRLCVAIALLKCPRYVFLDEPTIGLDPISWGMIKDMLLQFKKKYGTCALITGQDYEEMQKLCDTVSILEKGTILYNGSIKELIASYPGVLEFRYSYGQNMLDDILKKLELNDTGDEEIHRIEIKRDDGPVLLSKFKELDGVSGIVLRDFTLKEIFEKVVKRV